jgi:hypothetical protein
MKRIITTAGLAALGAASLAPSFAQGVGTKPWNVGATLRGFYDDNYMTFSKKTQDAAKITAPGFQEDTFGFTIAPDAAFNWKTDQTTVGLSYIYTLTYFADRSSPHDDQSHQANAKLSHAFSERYNIDVSDSFVIAQEPSILEPTAIGVALPLRTAGDNTRNTARINFDGRLSEQVGFDVGYNNTIYDFEQDGSNFAVGSYSAVLDRMEHLFYTDLNYQIQPKTTVGLGYQYGIIDFTSKDTAGFAPGFGLYRGDARDQESHFVTANARHNLNAEVDLSGKVGVQFTSYENRFISKDKVSPYAEAGVRWRFADASSIQFNLRHSRSATDVAADSFGSVVADAQATSATVAFSYAITPKIRLDAMAMYQHADFNNGGGGSQADDLFFGSLVATYQFTNYLAAEVGYMYDRLDSDLLAGARSYTRNRVFIGTRLTY